MSFFGHAGDLIDHNCWHQLAIRAIVTVQEKTLEVLILVLRTPSESAFTMVLLQKEVYVVRNGSDRRAAGSFGSLLNSD